jgi:hypothetical protein
MMVIEKIAAKGMHAQDFGAWHPATDAHGQFGAGGVVRGPVNAIIGEAGPEVVVPMKKKFMNKKVKDVVRHFKTKERQKTAEKKGLRGYYKLKKKKKPPQHGGFQERKDGSMEPNTNLGTRRTDAGMYGPEMGSLHSGGWNESASVRGGSQPNLRG